MQVRISFNISDRKEILNINGKKTELPICETFMNILSIDTNYIKEEIINKINYSSIYSIKKAYKQIVDIEPLLLIDEFNIFEHIENYNNSSKYLSSINKSIKELSNLINNSQSFNNKHKYELKNALTFLRKKRSIYKKLTNNLEKSITSMFMLVVRLLDLYKEMVNICFLNDKNEFFDGFSELSPLKKFVFYKMFILKTNTFFKDLPSSSINFTFDCSAEEFKNKLYSNSNKNIYNLLFNQNISPMYEYNCNSLEQLLQVSFFTSLTLGLNIKKCDNCNKFFIAHQRSDEKYCNRLSPQNSGKSCKQYAIFKNWKNNIETDYDLKIYRRIYMAKQMQTRRNPNDLKLKKEFDIWKKEAQAMRNQYVHGRIAKREFQKWLENN